MNLFALNIFRVKIPVLLLFKFLYMSGSDLDYGVPGDEYVVDVQSNVALSNSDMWSGLVDGYQPSLVIDKIAGTPDEHFDLSPVDFIDTDFERIAALYNGKDPVRKAQVELGVLIAIGVNGYRKLFGHDVFLNRDLIIAMAESNNPDNLFVAMAIRVLAGYKERGVSLMVDAGAEVGLLSKLIGGRALFNIFGNDLSEIGRISGRLKKMGIHTAR